MSGTVVVSGSPLADRAAELLADAGCIVRRGTPPAPWSRAPVVAPEQWEETLADADVLVVTPHDSCSAELLEHAPRLRGVVSMVIGVDTIDVAAAHERGLVIANGAVEENFLGLAEGAVLLMLALTLDLPGKQQVLREGIEQPANEMRGRMLRGARIGLVGFGRSARGVADRLRAFDVDLQTSDPFVDPATLPDDVRAVELDALLETSDVVSIHVTLSPQTRGLIGERELRAMKPTAYLVNTARGAVVDEQALARVLTEGGLAGAGLDVFEQEPLPADSPLRDLDNVILTPHMVGHSENLMAALPVAARDNVLRILAGEEPLHCMTPEAGLARWRERLAQLAEPTSRVSTT